MIVPVTAVGLLLVGVGGFWIQLREFVENQSISYHTRKAVRAVCESRCEKRDTDNYVDRVELRNRLKMTLIRKSDHDHSNKVKKIESRYVPTMIVCGPRGCGKSTLVAEIFGEEPAVINLSYNGISEDDFANAIFSSLQVKCPGGIRPSIFLEIVLKDVRDKEHKLPTLIVEVDKRFDGAHLEELLLICKHLGDDLKLVMPVVVLSSSRAAFGMQLCANVLRAKYVEVDDLSEDEARTFLFKALKTINATDDRKRDAVEFAVSAIGTRLVHLCEVAMVTSQYKSLNNFILEVKEYRQQSQKTYNIAFNKLVRTFPTLKNKKVLHILADGCELQDLCEMMKVTEDQLIEYNGLIEPQLLYVSPRLYRVCVGSHFVKEIIKK